MIRDPQKEHLINELIRGQRRARLPFKCKTAWRNYLGLKPPRCNGGQGCQVCWQIYTLKTGETGD